MSELNLTVSAHLGLFSSGGLHSSLSSGVDFRNVPDRYSRSEEGAGRALFAS